MNVNANDKTIEAILSGGFYQVPRFQRPYSWDTSEVEDFWEDVAESGNDYFIGSMVIFNGGAASGLVDGQQRLTTVTMMLAAIRNEFMRLGDLDAADGVQTLIERKDPKGKRRFVLHTESSYPYLQAAIQAQPGSATKATAVRAEERALERAFSLISEWTHSISDAAFQNQALSKAKQKQQAIHELGRQRDKIYALTVVLVEVDDEDDATTIFQTLNSRGKDLETADLVKAHLLQMLKAPNAQLDQPRDKWDAIRESFDESAANISMNRFLLHTWLSREEYVGEKDLFKRIKKRVRANNAQGYLDDLAADAKRYRTAQEPSFRTWKKPQWPVAYSLAAMSLFRLQQPLPFILSVLREYDAKTIKLPVLLRPDRGGELPLPRHSDCKPAEFGWHFADVRSGGTRSPAGIDTRGQGCRDRRTSSEVAGSETNIRGVRGSVRRTSQFTGIHAANEPGPIRPEQAACHSPRFDCHRTHRPRSADGRAPHPARLEEAGKRGTR